MKNKYLKFIKDKSRNNLLLTDISFNIWGIILESLGLTDCLKLALLNKEMRTKILNNRTFNRKYSISTIEDSIF